MTEDCAILLKSKIEYKWGLIYCKWPTTIVCIHFCQTYLTELPILLNPLLLLNQILDNSKCCNGPVNFKITRFNSIDIYVYYCCLTSEDSLYSDTMLIFLLMNTSIWWQFLKILRLWNFETFLFSRPHQGYVKSNNIYIYYIYKYTVYKCEIH